MFLVNGCLRPCLLVIMTGVYTGKVVDYQKSYT